PSDRSASRPCDTFLLAVKSCPYCGEQIQNAAVKCRFCGEWLDPTKMPPWAQALLASGAGTLTTSRTTPEEALAAPEELPEAHSTAMSTRGSPPASSSPRRKSRPHEDPLAAEDPTPSMRAWTPPSWVRE